ncbi:hypothetical protein HELRODRAFT_177538 [Helobdella robusta]|uniref:Armadillo repeat-containing domain-containing protein n=1 Tax=Helobdella robusta TaxID=6412 RepID=T1FBU7_HELRO|nr:hypothetical protein HELRODRAFT_177538 [Helobdella robusta]ESN97888.1 hypothetical protein HELRODRAFT_177538 [Helobdella robusta]
MNRISFSCRGIEIRLNWNLKNGKRNGHDSKYSKIGIYGEMDMYDVELKEKAAAATWSLSGSQNKVKTTHVMGGIVVMEMIMEKSSTLQRIGCDALAALVENDLKMQNKMSEGDALAPLTRLLRVTDLDRDVLISALKAITNLCLGLSYKNNAKVQQHLVKRDVLKILAEKLKFQIHSSKFDEEIIVELFFTISCMIFGKEQSARTMNSLFSIESEFVRIISLLKSKNKNHHLKIGRALTFLCINEATRLHMIKYVTWEHVQSIIKLFTEETNEPMKIDAAFQVIVFTKCIFNKQTIDLLAQSITFLVNIFDGGHWTMNDEYDINEKEIINSDDANFARGFSRDDLHVLTSAVVLFPILYPKLKLQIKCFLNSDADVRVDAVWKNFVCTLHRALLQTFTFNSPFTLLGDRIYKSITK